MTDKDRTDKTYDDGGSGTMSETQLNAFKAEVLAIASDVAGKVSKRRSYSEDIRFTRWAGQSPDGRKYDEKQPAKADGTDGEAFPFDGAPDERNRLADGVINVKKAMLAIGLMRSLQNPVVTGSDLQDINFAADMAQVLKWLVRSQWGSKFLRDAVLTADAMLSDSPGGVVVGMFMRQEMGLDEIEVTPTSIIKAMQEQGLVDEESTESLVEVMGLILDPETKAEAIELLMGIFPYLTKKRAGRVVRELREEGSSNFPIPVMVKNHPEPRVLRLYEDVFFVKDAMDLRKENVYVPEWIDAVELRGRIVTMGYSEKFVNRLLGKIDERGNEVGDERSKGFAGQSAFTNHESDPVSGDATASNESSLDYNKDRYEIITAYFRATNEDGIPAFYQQPFSNFVEVPATDRTLSYKIGHFPGVYFSREVLTKHLLDTRGFSELLMSDQSNLKMFSDLFGASAQLKTLPALKVAMRRAAAGPVKIGSLVNIKVSKPTDVEPLNLGAFPNEAFTQMENIEKRVAEYTGIPHEKVHGDIGAMINELDMLSWLSCWQEVFQMALQQVQEFFTDEQLERVSGSRFEPFRRTSKEIQGKFDLMLNFSVSDFDLESVMRKADILIRAKQVDTEQTILSSQLTRLIVGMTSPEHSDELLVSESAASTREIEDEENIYTKIIAGGVEPALDEDPNAKNYKLRLDWIENQMMQNPSWQESAQLNQQILMNHIENYTQMIAQSENASIGRSGTSLVLGEEA